MRRLDSAPESATRGQGRGRSRYPPKRSGVAEGDVNQGCGTFESETITAGLAPDGVYVYAEWGEGRRNRPLSQGEHGCPDRDRTLEGKPPQSRHNLPTQELLSPPKSSLRGSADAALALLVRIVIQYSCFIA